MLVAMASLSFRVTFYDSLSVDCPDLAFKAEAFFFAIILIILISLIIPCQSAGGGFLLQFNVFEKGVPLPSVLEDEIKTIAHLEVKGEACVALKDISGEIQALSKHRSLHFRHNAEVRHFHFLLK